ncbi:MAG: hypothetical protein HN919_07705 [Verrucomicrobia bacterium]|nr:hypothetical protein [Verrucomicrobiota bacterium]
MNATWPFAKLRATAGQIDITLRGLISSDEHFTFKKEDIVALRRKRGLFSVGLEIQHQVKAYAPYILFWSFRFSELRSKLEERGFVVEA